VGGFTKSAALLGLTGKMVELFSIQSQRKLLPELAVAKSWWVRDSGVGPRTSSNPKESTGSCPRHQFSLWQLKCPKTLVREWVQQTKTPGKVPERALHQSSSSKRVHTSGRPGMVKPRRDEGRSKGCRVGEDPPGKELRKKKPCIGKRERKGQVVSKTTDN